MCNAGNAVSCRKYNYIQFKTSRSFKRACNKTKVYQISEFRTSADPYNFAHTIFSEAQKISVGSNVHDRPL